MLVIAVDQKVVKVGKQRRRKNETETTKKKGKGKRSKLCITITFNDVGNNVYCH